MATHKFSVGVTSKVRAYSRNLRVRLLCDEGFQGTNGFYLRDSSGYGNDFSPHYCQCWIPNVTIFVNVCYTPRVQTGFYYECTTGGTTGTAEPSWPVVAGNTVTATNGTAVWTCRALPDFWTGASSQWARFNNAATTPTQTASRCRIEPALRNFCAPPLAGGVDWTSVSNTVSADSGTNTITDSATNFPALSVGDWVKMTWTSAADTSNSGYAKVLSTSGTTSITFTIGGINANETNKVLRLQKVLEPSALVFFCHVASTSTASVNLLQFLNLLVTTCGFKIILNNSRQIQFSASDLTGTASATTTTTALTSGLGLDYKIAVVVNRAAASLEFYITSGSTITRDSQVTLTKRQMCQLATSDADITQLDFGRRDMLSNGATQIRDYQIYCGQSLPSGLTGSGTPTLLQQLVNGTPLSPTDWP